MLAPVPAEPVFTVGRLIVRPDVPIFLEDCLRLRAAFSTFLATFVGGGGGAGGGGAGSGLGILGREHIVLFFSVWNGYCFVLNLIVVLQEVYYLPSPIVKVESCWLTCGKKIP